MLLPSLTLLSNHCRNTVSHPHVVSHARLVLSAEQSFCHSIGTKMAGNQCEYGDAASSLTLL